MAMACALATSLSSLALSSAASSSIVSSSSSCHQGLRRTGFKLVLAPVGKVSWTEKRNVIVRAAAEEAAGDSTPSAPSDPALVLKLQSELLKKKAKKLELKRKRLVRKRHLRKKGRWPPAKVNKTKNI
ncbi:hypothetical protein MPTK1_6g16600 [Marchantia polymorpha subsp. ruderalis]|nr:hypothetical protein MARPO_0170s0017 [Marchantia polymorpha]BBN15054.1 hypothetical protein Mp_6g16600 [Marchantia polymorpha subsp. ruderalis]|eukprot:PTQ28213.1 hypothetical protein MARPO_0170s0017 [Marchantia polymorpha]